MRSTSRLRNGSPSGARSRANRNFVVRPHGGGMGAQSPSAPRNAATENLNLDSPFERLTALACAMFSTPHAMVGLVDGDRTLFRANVGIAQTEMRRDLTATHLMVGMG